MEKEDLSIMRTAVLTAFPKIFTDIQFASEIFHQGIVLANKHGFSFAPELFVNQMAVEIEARFKGTSRALCEQIKAGVGIVIEVAAGLSPRSLQFAQVPYFECDLKPVCALKKEIFKGLNRNEKAKNIFSVDLTDVKGLKNFLLKVSKDFRTGKAIIVSEGLFWYLKREDIQTMAKIFVQVFGDRLVWISPDCPPDMTNSEDYRKKISDSAKSKRNTFRDKDDFVDFFEKLGFGVSCRRLSELVPTKQISSGKTFALTDEQIRQKIDSYVNVAVMTAKTKNP